MRFVFSIAVGLMVLSGAVEASVIHRLAPSDAEDDLKGTHLFASLQQQAPHLDRRVTGEIFGESLYGPQDLSTKGADAASYLPEIDYTARFFELISQNDSLLDAPE